MNSHKKIILVVFISIFSFFFLTSTFINTKYKENDILSFSTWSYIYEKDKFIKKSDNSFSKEKIYKNNISYLNEIYYKWDIFDIDWNKINLKNWIYIFNIEDISKSYEINFSNYKVILKSPWEFIIDNRILSNIKFININSILKLDVLKNWKISNTLSVFPHIYMFLNSNRDVSWFDLYKLEIVYRIWYIKNKILNNNNLDLTFLKNIFWTQKIEDIFNIYFSSYLNKKMTNNTNFKDIEYSLDRWSNNINKEIDETWNIEFINKSKEQNYYKKKIVSSTIKMLNSKKEDLDDIYNKEIKNNIDLLLKIPKLNLDDINKILTSYYFNILNLDNIDYIEHSFFLSKIINAINSSKNDKFLLSYFTLNKIAKLNDLWFKEDKYFFEKYLFFIKNYFKENNIIFNDEEKIIDIKKSKSSQELDYIRQYTKNILIYWSKFDENNFTYNIEILAWYLEIEKLINIDNKKTYTYIIENYLVFENIYKNIFLNFFEKSRNERNLLILKKNKIDLAQLEKLNIFFKKYNNFVQINNKYLKLKDKIYLKSYNDLYINFIEYYEAFKNYSNYVIIYDKTKSNILNANTISVNKDIILSKPNLTNYLLKFNSLDLNSAESVIVDNNYYTIKNVIINWDNYSFYLYPKDNNRIKNFIKNWKKIDREYVLNEMEKYYNEKISEVEEREMYKYDFKNFFINTFYPIKKENIQQTEENKIFAEETSDIIKLKNEKLLAWDFKLIKNILDIKYENITVNFNKKTNKFDIKVKNSKINLNLTSPEWEQKNYIWEFSWEYVFDTNNHFFKNIRIKFIDNDYSDWENIVYLFWWKEFIYIPKIDIINFEQIIKQKVLDFINKNI